MYSFSYVIIGFNSNNKLNYHGFVHSFSETPNSKTSILPITIRLNNNFHASLRLVRLEVRVLAYKYRVYFVYVILIGIHIVNGT